MSNHRLGRSDVIVSVKFRDVFPGRRKPFRQFFSSRVLIKFIRRSDSQAFQSSEQRQRGLFGVVSMVPTGSFVIAAFSVCHSSRSKGASRGEPTMGIALSMKSG